MPSTGGKTMVRRLIRRWNGPSRRSEAIQVVLWGKADCGLCDRALTILERLSDEYSLKVEKRDILADPVAYERFRFVIPVVEIEGGERLEGKITELWLRRALDRATGH
ncbi:MAG: glutaredoxin family protein [Chloroflexota bacterium]